MSGRAIAALLAAVWLAGCSLGDEEEPRKPGQGTSEVSRAVEQLEQATREGDYAEVCDELFSAAARRRSGGEDCESALAENAEGLERPRLTLRAIELGEDSAEARVRTTAAGQEPVEETIVFVREAGGYRIESLGD